MFSEHVFIIPRPVFLGKEFTISVRILSPLFPTMNYKTIAQDKSGLGGILVITPDCKHVGTFSMGAEPQFIDSGIDLSNECEKAGWYHIAMSYSQNAIIETEEDIETKEVLIFYLNGVKKSEVFLNGHVLNRYIKYVGNSMDYTEPAGFICDFKVVDKFYRFKDDKKKLPDNVINHEHKAMCNILDLIYLLPKETNPKLPKVYNY